MNKRALISVYDKTGVADFARGLVARGFEVISTGGTQRALAAAGVPVTGVETVTGFPEMLDGRVKTLHPRIHAGILARRDDPAHMAALTDHDITPVDVVAVNLYPFAATIHTPGVTDSEAIEQIDIGGPSALRAAAKNSASVWAVVDAADYDAVLAGIDADDAQLRRQLAAKVFRTTAAYDAQIAAYLTTDEFPATFTPTYAKKQDLRYGENSHQAAAFYTEPYPAAGSIAAAQQLHGKELSFNNIKDADAALLTLADFDGPTVVAMKHMNPCGIGQAATIEGAWDKAFAADPVSIFGGIIALNREVDAATATKMHKLFLEIIIAPSFSPEALTILTTKKKNLRLMTVDMAANTDAKEYETIAVHGGLLIQERDKTVEEGTDLTVVTVAKPTPAQIDALVFAQKVVKHVKSNAIVVAKAGQTLGIGAGQMNRVGSVEIALAQAQQNANFAGAVLASDAFFPMGDSVDYAAKHGIRAIIQPGGSIRDQESIDKANEYGITMVTTGVRHFRH
ncbi:bifunctional phosphoribosylaminoimidazolecarboxamide formyltransferase/IMP cyclohydrolase [Lacticaseibacillus sharpeae]|uniref:Bifunctional purine biosynthesis protein PurH n=1 Tax=Lacticaseibacillus sharpeae JCM 1186 = DSM 20505 TaxID=1291052 RepID=A0A0R1ZJG6_9LACO|nr:bifunctional phosphoribosylaminoimidazolecarboxamide formyltransferase/IMP cyclohydrolase [Lacticaseibacillus sharpeae]KRM54522.1 bifunctional phosphoribosylaminoimidazolecarboxamide formyltransferase IMP cyclohydrolase [Lacticaseibacillus sharpeae JCM 1186 = DSM 20505]